MKFKLFKQLYSEALETNDLDMYVAERGWQHWMDNREKPADDLTTIYKLAHATLKQTRIKTGGLSQTNFSNQFAIPLRTWQDWEYGKRTPPIYVKLLVDYAVFNYE
ncbi:hypothetical protein LQF60_02840 [Tetragenococcus koreensis]|uniref:helix-turn-helix domain-containing protein n=1 Tax=Tetragenococcus koreensis TaxID=290335 RepID=UPI001F392754|nr:hypothetical protein [Tetragenococcus koreensis]MCF1585249.1 hypothetical protein [Tetragenococcus koreensis]MCF1628774.1 hypothetical protein [Tetragenococcus koreensis]MDN6664518.1 hypothetical protein [Tetragenococcus koreensis]